MSCEVAIDPGLLWVGWSLQDDWLLWVRLNDCLLFTHRWLTLARSFITGLLLHTGQKEEKKTKMCQA